MSEKISGADAAAVESAGSSASDAATARHTPGPWKVPGVFNLSDTYCTTITNELLGGKVATLTLCEDRETSRANAHLIAAAPEMYEALKLVTKLNGTSADANAWAKAHAAISKAEGVSK